MNLRIPPKTNPCKYYKVKRLVCCGHVCLRLRSCNGRTPGCVAANPNHLLITLLLLRMCCAAAVAGLEHRQQDHLWRDRLPQGCA
jgi:hypothetical protein